MKPHVAPSLRECPICLAVACGCHLKDQRRVYALLAECRALYFALSSLVPPEAPADADTVTMVCTGDEIRAAHKALGRKP